MRHLTALCGALLTALLAGCGATAVSGEATPHAHPSTGTTAPAPGDPSTPAAGDDDTPVADACGLTERDYATIRDSLRTAELDPIGGYLAPTVYVTYASSENQGSVDGNPALILQNLQDVSYPGVSWNFEPPASDLAAWRASPFYGEDFTDCSIVGIQSEERGVSLTVVDGLITRQLITYSVEAWSY